MAEPDLSNPDDLISRAMASLIHQANPNEEEAPAEESPKMQPWAETASPTGKNKRPLEALVAEFEARVAAAPEAKAAIPHAPPPSETYFDRFTRPAPGTGRRRRRRGGGRGRDTGPRQAPEGSGNAAGTPGTPPPNRSSSRRRRRRR